jgi:2-oxoglutarate dehydrogenase E2 component (dihydrolipoamide succinyltransferase)
MATFELKMPKLGESITEATITKWLKQAGDKLELDDAILEIATDKVDSEIPSPVEGTLKELLFSEGDTVAVDTVIAVIVLEGEDDDEPAGKDDDKPAGKEDDKPAGKDDDKPAGKEDDKPAGKEDEDKAPKQKSAVSEAVSQPASGRFYSPLVRNIAKEENIEMEELESIPGSGKDNRLTKQDLLDYLKNRDASSPGDSKKEKPSAAPAKQDVKHNIPVAEGDEVIEMDRMRRLIAEHMVYSRDTSVHITLFADADVSKLVAWRNKQKDALQKRENQKLTFTPIFIQAISDALRAFPMVNVSLDANKIIKRKNINVGMAVALPNGNLIVPVIKNTDHKSLLGIVKEVNDLAARARENKLQPDEIQGGTFTLTNFGTFGATTGTPIINQPQVAILGVGLIKKQAVVIDTPEGDAIAVRHMMTVSLACDHRIVDGALGGMFLKKVVENLEQFDTEKSI